MKMRNLKMSSHLLALCAGITKEQRSQYKKISRSFRPKKEFAFFIFSNCLLLQCEHLVSIVNIFYYLQSLTIIIILRWEYKQSASTRETCSETRMRVKNIAPLSEEIQLLRKMLLYRVYYNT